MTTLGQDEADRLIAIEKIRADAEAREWPGAGGSISIPILSYDRRDQFLIDVNRGRVDLLKVTYQERCHTCIPLIRLDIRGPDHMNPDGEIIPCPHLHVYREGWGTRWARPAPADFTDHENHGTTLSQFFSYCNVIEPPFLDFRVSDD